MQGTVLDSPISDYQFSHQRGRKNYVVPMFLNLWKANSSVVSEEHAKLILLLI